ncbi:hypothetical protein [Mariprofundus sp. KV]|uniref:hypothetical protein n=1 Tax=Mariprofundus sp. KV TaxID=2608715 RepID=UPI0015A26093|nr:hypothetical protein [Mariprofundus sp. KV]NWF36855.1 hypothetical protein [Mariprofundus sp. KV]
MTLKKLLTRLNFFDTHALQQRESEEGLSKVIEKLQEKERQLRVTISLERDEEERELLQQELSIVVSQTRKGTELLARIREEGDS